MSRVGSTSDLFALGVGIVNDPVTHYFENFQVLAENQMWLEIIHQGEQALRNAKLFNKTEEEAIICAHLVSTYFHLKKYDEALSYATHCRELSKYFSDPAVFVRAINIESATYRQLASKQDNDQTKQLNYQRAIEIAFEAKSMYSEKNLNNPKLEGRIHFNLGEICKNNPKSNIEEAIHYYLHANSCFEKVEETRNLLIQTLLCLGQTYLLQKNYELTQEMINKIRQKLSFEYGNEQVISDLNHLEEQLKTALT